MLVLQACGTEDRVLGGEPICERVGLDRLGELLCGRCFLDRNICYLSVLFEQLDDVD
jgi:hypothetical protein